MTTIFYKKIKHNNNIYLCQNNNNSKIYDYMTTTERTAESIYFMLNIARRFYVSLIILSLFVRPVSDDNKSITIIYVNDLVLS